LYASLLILNQISGKLHIIQKKYFSYLKNMFKNCLVNNQERSKVNFYLATWPLLKKEKNNNMNAKISPQSLVHEII